MRDLDGGHDETLLVQAVVGTSGKCESVGAEIKLWPCPSVVRGIQGRRGASRAGSRSVGRDRAL